MRKTISIVTPCFNEHDNVRPCRDAVAEVFADTLADYDYEHLFADNASTDDTPTILREMAEEDPRVKVILNARNVGPFRNTFNALKSTSGDAVVLLLAADLQDPPELVVDFVKHWEEGYYCVYGVRSEREEGFMIRSARRIFYRLINKFSDSFIPPDAGEYQLVDRRVIEVLRGIDDHYPYIRGLVANCGFKSKGIPYTWRKRKHGKSKNRIYHLIDQALNGFVSTSNVPTRLALMVGFTLSLLSVVYAIVQLVINLVFSDAPPGLPTLIVALFFFSGVQLFFTGLIGEYITAIHSQVRRGPGVIELDRINLDPAEEPRPPAGDA